MAIKTFNIGEDTYDKFSRFCKDRGMSMSKQVEMFMDSVVEEEPEAKKEYIEKLERIRNEKFIRMNSLAERYKLK